MAMMGAMGRVILAMTNTLDLAQVLQQIVKGLVDELDCALARVWLMGPADRCGTCDNAGICDERAQCLHLAASAGLSDRLDGTFSRIPVGRHKIGAVYTSRETVSINDLSSDPRIADKDWVRRESLRSFAACPLAFRGDILGIIGVFSRQEMTPDKLERLEVFAAHATVAIKNARLFEEVSRLSHRLSDENEYLKEEIDHAHPVQIVGTSRPIAAAIELLERVAPTSATVLLLGETGTGKELFARYLHARSPRRDHPLVKVNSAAISPTLIESELFGHEKGAFTGALQRRKGRFELAHGGTLFLDEVGELPLEAQAKLLRVLQDREFERVGGTESIQVDVRIVCATNRDLATEVRERRFREDLYYRINVFPIEMPPLRDRREDISLLTEAFLPQIARRIGRKARGVDPDAMRALSDYDWPGNVRKLQNVLERATILARGPLITRAELPDLRISVPVEIPNDASVAGSDGSDGTSLREQVDAFERTRIVEALQRTGGNQTEAARQLRMSRATLQYKLKSHGL
jgi:transcriptional regulator with GAF, ATPase, and Fis domain